VILRGAASDAAELEALAARRVAGEPLEQLVGWVDFGGLQLSVGPGVFVPRQRSLLLARAAVQFARSHPDPIVLELYAGVAPIAATVARRVSTAQVHAAERDPAALHHARRNLPPDAGIYLADRFQGLPTSLLGRVDLLVAVPPYVPDGELGLLAREARDFEPTSALTAGVDGLDEHRALLGGGIDWLRPGGLLLAELHRAQAPAAVAHARLLGYAARARFGGDGQTALIAAVAP
jgi:release factor glutamine methyltransferase